MNTKRILSAAILGLGLIAFKANATIAAVVDQSFDATGGGASLNIVSSQYVAQTFEVGLTGRLDAVDLMIGRTLQTTGTFTLSIFSTISGAPDSVAGLLLEKDFSVGVINEYQTFPTTFTYLDLSSENLLVNAGDNLAIAISYSGFYPEVLRWQAAYGDGYTEGSTFHVVGDFSVPWTNNATMDLGFKTYVSAVPVPPAAWLFGSALIGLVGFGKRSRLIIQKQYPE